MNPLESNMEPLRLGSSRRKSSSPQRFPSSPFRASVLSVSDRPSPGAVTLSTWMHVVLIAAHVLYGLTNSAWNPLLCIWLFMQENFSLPLIGFVFAASRFVHCVASPLLFSVISGTMSLRVALAFSCCASATFRIAMLVWKQSTVLVSMCMVISTCAFGLAKQILDKFTNEVVLEPKLQSRYSIFGGFGWVFGGCTVCLLIAKTDAFWIAFVWGAISCLVLMVLWIFMVPVCEYCLGSPQRMSQVELRTVDGLPQVSFSSASYIAVSLDTLTDSNESPTAYFCSMCNLCWTQFNPYQFRILFSFLSLGYAMGLTSAFNFIILYRHHVYFKKYDGYFNGVIFVFFALLLFIQFSSEMIGFVTFSWLSAKIGSRGCLVVCFVLVALRLIVYGASSDHSWVRESLSSWGSYLAFIGSIEVFHGISFAYAWCLTTQMSQTVSSPFIKSFFQELSKSFLVGFGTALGALCGGLMFSYQGLCTGYIVSAVALGLLAVLEMLCPLCLFRNDPLLDDIDIGDEEAEEYGYFYYTGVSPAAQADV